MLALHRQRQQAPQGRRLVGGGRTGGGLSFSEGWSFPPLIAGPMRKRRGTPAARSFSGAGRQDPSCFRPSANKKGGGGGGRAAPRGASLLINAAGLFSRSEGQSAVSSLRTSPFAQAAPPNRDVAKAINSSPLTSGRVPYPAGPRPLSCSHISVIAPAPAPSTAASSSSSHHLSALQQLGAPGEAMSLNLWI